MGSGPVDGHDVRGGWECADLSVIGLVGACEADGEVQQAADWMTYVQTATRGESFLAWAKYRGAAQICDLVQARFYDEYTAVADRGDLDRQRRRELAARVCDPYSSTAARLAVMLRISQRAAETLLDEALAARDRLPLVAGLLRAGVLTVGQFQRVVARTALVDDPVAMAAIDRRLAEVLGEGGPGTTGRLQRLVDRVLMVCDPEAIRRREDAAAAKKRVTSRPLDGGLSALTVTASAEDVALAMAALEALIAGVCPNDPRTKAQRRSAAATARLRGVAFTCECGDPVTCTAMLDDQAVSDRQARIVIHVICRRETLDGGAGPGVLDGHGPISGRHVRDLAQRPDTRLRPLNLDDITEPHPDDPDGCRSDGDSSDGDGPDWGDDAFDSGLERLLDAAIASYLHANTGGGPEQRSTPRPDTPAPRRGDTPHPQSVRLAAMALPRDPYRLATTAEVVIRFLWGTCTVPGCDRPAWACELDHTTEYDQLDPAAGGPTCLCNIAPKCPFHHALKTFAHDWIDDLYPDDDTGHYWTETTTPEHHSARKPAENQWLFPELTHLHCRHQSITTTTPESPPRSRPQAGDRLSPTRAKHAWRRRERARLRRNRRLAAERSDTDTGPPPF